MFVLTGFTDNYRQEAFSCDFDKWINLEVKNAGINNAFLNIYAKYIKADVV